MLFIDLFQIGFLQFAEHLPLVLLVEEDALFAVPRVGQVIEVLEVLVVERALARIALLPGDLEVLVGQFERLDGRVGLLEFDDCRFLRHNQRGDLAVLFEHLVQALLVVLVLLAPPALQLGQLLFALLSQVSLEDLLLQLPSHQIELLLDHLRAFSPQTLELFGQLRLLSPQSLLLVSSGLLPGLQVIFELAPFAVQVLHSVLRFFACSQHLVVGGLVREERG